jgi:hypothetical protein
VKFIRDPLKYEEACTVFQDAINEYMDKHTTRVPNEMIVFHARVKKTKTDVE